MRCTYPYDGVSLMFKVIKSGALVRYYHLKDTPLVPGFKMGKCKPNKFYKIYTEGDRPQTVGAEYCGGIKKQFVKKGKKYAWCSCGLSKKQQKDLLGGGNFDFDAIFGKGYTNKKGMTYYDGEEGFYKKK